ncbi:MAG: response regulator [Thermodesulfovibrionales bacterium]|jgi:CheY-like chemotaxis protein
MTEKTILVIDTDAETSQRIKFILESEGYTVHNSAGRNDSISAAVKIKPSLIFINIAMRDTSGLEIAKGIHEMESLKDIPIIIITPHGGTIEARYTAMYGIVDFIKKAFSPEELISKTIDVVEMKSPDQPAVGEIFPIQAHEQETAALSPDEEPVLKEIQAEEIPAPEIVPLQAAIEGLSEKPVPEYIREPEAAESEGPAGKSGPDIHSTEPEVALPDEEIHENISETVGSKAGRRSMTLVLFIVLVITAAGAGFYFYTDSSGKPETPQPAPVKPPQPVMQEAQKVEPTPEQQEAKQMTEKSKPEAPVSQPQKTPDSQQPAEETKPAAVQQKVKKNIASAKEEKKPFYSVQIGIFKKEANASALVKHFTKLNYKAFSYKTIGKNKKALYRVLIGRFDNKKEADALAKTIKSKENTKALIFRESGKPL